MLTRFHKILLGLLAVQLILIAVVMGRGSDDAALKEHLLVPGFDVAKVTRGQVSSSGEGAKTVDLVKKDAGWVVASSFASTRRSGPAAGGSTASRARIRRCSCRAATGASRRSSSNKRPLAWPLLRSAAVRQSSE